MIKFKAIVPPNMQKSLSNGDVRITLDADVLSASIIPELIKLAGHMVTVNIEKTDKGQLEIRPMVEVSPTSQEFEELEAVLLVHNTRSETMGAIHAAITEYAESREVSAQAVKDKIKEKMQLDSLADATDEQLDEIMERLKKMKEENNEKGEA